MKFNMNGGKLRGEEKRIYLDACRSLVETDDIESRDFLLSKLKEQVYSEASTYSSDNPQINETIKDNLDVIFNPENFNPENLMDNDGKIENLLVLNVVSLQCAVLFTYACFNFTEPVENSIIHDYQSFYNFTDNVKYVDLSSNPEKDWRIYKNVDKERLKNMLKYFYKPYRGIITILDILTIDDIIIPYLDDWFICGLVYKITMADDIDMTPLEFIIHDCIHYRNYLNFCYRRRNKDKEEIMRFFNFIQTTEPIKNEASIKTILYLLLHEGSCYWDDLDRLEDTRDPKRMARDPNSMFYTQQDEQREDLGDLTLARFFNDNDLGLTIPKHYRNPDDVADDHRRRLEYLEKALANYVTALKYFKKKRKSQNTFGGKKLTKKQTKKQTKKHTHVKLTNKKNKHNKTNKMKKRIK